MQTPLIQPETQRLKLRQWQASDYAPYAALNADPQVMEHFPNTLDKTASDAMADKIRSLITEQGWGFWVVERKDTHAFIGSVGLHRPTANLPFNPCVEIGWRLAAEHWGNGYATEAAQAALQVGFATLGLEEIVAFTALNNLQSQAVMERLGMQRDEDTFEHPDVPIGNPLREHCLYRMTAVSYFTNAEETLKKVQEGRGKFASHASVRNWLSTWGTELESKPPRCE